MKSHLNNYISKMQKTDTKINSFTNLMISKGSEINSLPCIYLSFYVKIDYFSNLLYYRIYKINSYLHFLFHYIAYNNKHNWLNN